VGQGTCAMGGSLGLGCEGGALPECSTARQDLEQFVSWCAASQPAVVCDSQPKSPDQSGVSRAAGAQGMGQEEGRGMCVIGLVRALNQGHRRAEGGRLQPAPRHAQRLVLHHRQPPAGGHAETRQWPRGVTDASSCPRPCPHLYTGAGEDNGMDHHKN
jgi:hypothetical protein